MTTKLLSPPVTGSTRQPTGRATGQQQPTAGPRPMVLVATLGGLVAAAGPLLVCLALGVIGWFLVDAGAHGTSDDGLHHGALAWLLGHGAGTTVAGTPVTLVPLGLTLLVAWTTWRVAVRTGEALAGHGPDADRLADGERDLTVPVAAGLFAAGYLAVGIVVLVVTVGAPTLGSLLGLVVVAVLVGGPGIAVGSGRAAVWAGLLPPAVPATAAACRRILLGLGAASLLVVIASLVVSADEVVNVFARLHTGTGEAVTMVVLALALLPNAAAYASAWLLGPGFAVGTQTVVSPSLVVLGPVPMFPLLGALPADGTPAAWTVGALAVPPVVAAIAVAANQRRHPTSRWEQGALRGCVAGLLAAVALTALCWLAGGALGTGRMGEIGPAASAVLLHAVPGLALGGLVGGLLATWRQRRTAVLAD